MPEKVEEVAPMKVEEVATPVDAGEEDDNDDANKEDDKTEELQLRIDGISTWAQGKDVKKRLEVTLRIKDIRRCKKQPKTTYAFVYFHTEEWCDKAKSLIDGHWWKGEQLYCRRANKLDPERFAKRQRRDEGSSAAADAADAAGAADAADTADAAAPAPPPLRTVADCVTPLHGMPYEEQLLCKRQTLLNALKELPGKWQTAMKGVPKDVHAKWRVPFVDPAVTAAWDGAPCELAPVIPAPRRFGYRNPSPAQQAAAHLPIPLTATLSCVLPQATSASSPLGETRQAARASASKEGRCVSSEPWWAHRPTAPTCRPR